MSLRISLETRCGNRRKKKLRLCEDFVKFPYKSAANPMIGLDLGQLHSRICFTERSSEGISRAKSGIIYRKCVVFARRVGVCHGESVQSQ
jgi:hypothetical protein